MQVCAARARGSLKVLCRAISSQLDTYQQSEKNLLNIIAISPPHVPHNITNFSPLAAEIGSAVWGTPANFNGFGVLAALLHGTLVVGVIQTLRR